MSQLNHNARGDHGTDVPVLVTDNPPGGIRVNGEWESNARLIFRCPPNVTGGATVYYDNGRKTFRVIVPPEDPPGAQWEAGLWPCLPPEYNGDSEKVAFIYEPAVVRLPRLVAVQRKHYRYFGLETGEYFSLIDCTDFQLLHHEIFNPAQVDLVGPEREAIGFNCGRVLGTCAQMFHLFPQEIGITAYLEAIERLSDKMARRQRYLNFVVNADHQLVQYNPFLLWNQVGEIARAKSNMILSFNNENDQAVNRIDGVETVQPIPGVLCSRGSNGYAQNTGPEPHMGWIENHINGAEWQRKSHNTWEEGVAAGRPPMTTETARAADRDNDPNHHEDDGKVAAAFCGGKTFHAASLRYSQLLQPGVNGQPGELECAIANVRGMRSVPLRFQDGQYERMPQGDNLRVYRSVLPDEFLEIPVRF